MKRSQVLYLAQCENKKLQSAATSNYWVVLRLLCQSLPSTVTSRLSQAIETRDFVALVEGSDWLGEQKYLTPSEHYASNQLVALIKKYPYPGCEELFQPEKVAFEKFVAAEARCLRYNRLFRLRRAFGRDKESAVMERMRRWIQYVLGSEPNFQSIWHKCDFGPGASIGVGGNATNPARKLLSKGWSVSPSALSYFTAAVMANPFMRRSLYHDTDGFHHGTTAPHWALPGMVVRKRCEIVHYNKIEFVPKTVKTYRSIAVEPLGNGFVQKGIDNEMRDKLRRIGIDLRMQEPNAEFARLGSLDDSPWGFVTLDLSSASDSISTELVKELLPERWYEFLNNVRSKSFKYKDREVPYEKFCSMGNGFCFPLQTLLFCAMCHAVGAGEPGKDFRVYGDDIVVRKCVATKIKSLLWRCGFRLNVEKSHIDGPFRESCGADWFGGVDVRPYTLDEPFANVQAVFKFLNATRTRPKWEAFFEPCRNFVLLLLKKDMHLWRPFPGAPDTGLDSTGDEHLTSRHVKYLKHGIWRWSEMVSSAKVDVISDRVGRGGDACIAWYAALSGRPADKPYTLRHTTETTVRHVSHGGAISKWLPPFARDEQRS